MAIRLTYVLDKRKAYKGNKPVPILADVRYDVNGKGYHFRFSIGLSTHPKGLKSQTIRPSEPNSEEKNGILKKVKETTEGIYLNAIVTGKIQDPNSFKAAILSKYKSVEQEKGTIDHLNSYIAYLEARNKSKSIVGNMERLKDLLIEIEQKGINISLDTIDLQFETAMRKEMATRGYKQNTVSSYLKRMKMFLNWCVKNNLNRNMIYKQFDITEEQKEIVALNDIEIHQIAELDIPTHKNIEKGLKLSRDWFLVTSVLMLFAVVHSSH